MKGKEMEKKIEVTTLKISIGNRELELSVEDAKKLHAALSELFSTKVKHEHHYDGWRWPYTSPVITYTAGTATGTVVASDSVTITDATLTTKAYLDSAKVMNPEGQ